MKERQKRASNLNERNVGRTGKKPQTIISIFCVLSQQQHTFIQQASKSLLIVFHPTEIYLYFARSHFVLPSVEEEKYSPDPGFDRPIFMAYTQRVFDRIFFADVRLYETGRNGMSDVEGLYIVLFF